MLRNYFIVAIRNLLGHKMHSGINILGLAVGMACCALIFLYVQHELSYDQFHKKVDRIYRVVGEYENDVTGDLYQIEATPYRLTELIRERFPEIEHVVRLYGNSAFVRYGDKRFSESWLYFADANVFDMFSFSLIKGDPKTALVEPHTIVITEAFAQKYFGGEDPMGKTLLLWDEMPEAKVTGVMQTLPENSHLKINALLSMAVSKDFFSDTTLNTWRNGLYTYVLLRQGASGDALKEKLPAFVDELHGMDASFAKLILRPLIHLRLNIQFVYTISGIAVFVLVIACLNFMNLSTARSVVRAREIGMRKVVGAHRRHLIGQFLGESVLLSCLALILMLLIVELALPVFNGLMEKELRLVYWGLWMGVPMFAGVAALVGLVAGSYPAFVLSKFQPLQVLKGHFKGDGKGVIFRNVLVGIQFGLSVILLICTGVAFEQLVFMRTKSLGFEKENVIVIQQSRFVHAQLDAFKTEVLKHPNVLQVSATRNVPPDVLHARRYDVVPEGQSPIEITVLIVDEDYFGVLGVPFVLGRNFSKERATDAREAVIVNQAAMRAFGWSDPLGTAVGVPYMKRQGQVVGVVADFHFESLYREVGPMVFIMTPRWYGKFAVRVRSDNISQTVAHLKHTWDTFVPERPFGFYFLDDKLEGLYQADIRRGYISGSLTGLAIFVACLGLYGLASFLLERRTAEIGIRKVLGASVPHIVLLLSRGLLKPVMVAVVIAWPLAYVMMDRWLQGFAYRVDLGFGIFLLGGALGVAIALATVSVQAWKAAQVNPIEALKCE